MTDAVNKIISILIKSGLDDQAAKQAAEEIAGLNPAPATTAKLPSERTARAGELAEAGESLAAGMKEAGLAAEGNAARAGSPFSLFNEMNRIVQGLGEALQTAFRGLAIPTRPLAGEPKTARDDVDETKTEDAAAPATGQPVNARAQTIDAKKQARTGEQAEEDARAIREFDPAKNSSSVLVAQAANTVTDLKIILQSQAGLLAALADLGPVMADLQSEQAKLAEAIAQLRTQLGNSGP